MATSIIIVCKTDKYDNNKTRRRQMKCKISKLKLETKQSQNLIMSFPHLNKGTIRAVCIMPGLRFYYEYPFSPWNDR